MQVDAVITWVDGGDANWRAKREYHSGEPRRDLLPFANGEGRYRDNDDLLFLLRSMEQFWGIDGNIFIVTDQQVPSFIAEHPRLRIVDHSQILDARYLPTFSSRAIESALHHIPDLAEHFVSFNDDQMLTRPVKPADFFSAVGAMVFLTREPIPTGDADLQLSGHNDASNARHWMQTTYGASSIAFIPEHAPKGIRKSWMMELEAAHPEIFDEVRQEKFRRRTGQSILANLYLDWCATHGRADIGWEQCRYLFTDDVEHDRVASLLDSLGRHLCICINDTTDDRSDVATMRDKLDRIRSELFPRPSDFESAGGLASVHA
ncbi:MAG: Stealth CR1 domain-containing protein [Gammaproteobacteria bacterium]|nr:Stealth CR1 domain-containing protein [Gammaproteobacteria bacterium]